MLVASRYPPTPQLGKSPTFGTEPSGIKKNMTMLPGALSLSTSRSFWSNLAPCKLSSTNGTGLPFSTFVFKMFEHCTLMSKIKIV